MVEGEKLLVEVVMEERKRKTRSVQRTVVKMEEQLIVCQVQVSSFNEFQTQRLKIIGTPNCLECA